MELLKQYDDALNAIYQHVGFEEDWVIYPIDDQTDKYWSENGDTVKFAKSIEQFNSDGDYYSDQIYKQRFYSKWVYEGEKFTMVFCDPMTDGMKWFRIFDNNKKIK